MVQSSSRDNSHLPFAQTCSLFHFPFLYIISIVARILYTNVWWWWGGGCSWIYGIWPMATFTSRVVEGVYQSSKYKSTQPTNDLVKINPPRRPLVFTPRPTLYHTPYSIPMLSRIAPATKRSVQQAVKPVVQVNEYTFSPPLSTTQLTPNRDHDHAYNILDTFCFHQACCHSSRCIHHTNKRNTALPTPIVYHRTQSSLQLSQLVL